MSFKPKTGCHVCERVKAGDKKLFDRINLSKAFVPGGEALTAIAKDISISYESVYNHTQKHQAPSKAKLAKQIKAKETKEALKEIATQTDSKVLSVSRHFTEDIAELKAHAIEGIRSGDTKVSAAVYAKLIDIEAKLEEKAKDREFELMKMFNYWNAQGGNPQDYLEYTDVEEGEIVE